MAITTIERIKHNVYDKLKVSDSRKIIHFYLAGPVPNIEVDTDPFGYWLWEAWSIDGGGKSYEGFAFIPVTEPSNIIQIYYCNETLDAEIGGTLFVDRKINPFLRYYIPRSNFHEIGVSYLEDIVKKTKPLFDITFCKQRKIKANKKTKDHILSIKAYIEAFQNKLKLVV